MNHLDKQSPSRYDRNGGATRLVVLYTSQCLTSSDRQHEPYCRRDDGRLSASWLRDLRQWSCTVHGQTVDKTFISVDGMRYRARRKIVLLIAATLAAAAATAWDWLSLGTGQNMSFYSLLLLLSAY